jgi:hypothetical protein
MIKAITERNKNKAKTDDIKNLKVAFFLYI